MLGRALHCLKETLFPIFCVECAKEGEWWCADCRGRIRETADCRCPVCAVATARGEVCRACQAVSCLDGATAFFSYDENTPAAKLIRQFKYGHAADIADTWKQVWERRGSNFWLWLSRTFPAAIIPVPLHPRRERERGFNQAKILAGVLLEILNSQGQPGQGGAALQEDELARSRYTVQQIKLSKEERLNNMTGAFVWRSRRPAPARVLLVDDVFTTGATMQECAKVLKAKGAGWVWGVTLARG